MPAVVSTTLAVGLATSAAPRGGAGEFGAAPYRTRWVCAEAGKVTCSWCNGSGTEPK